MPEAISESTIKGAVPDILCDRFSSEMLLKAAKMQPPIVVSRSSPTGRAISLARDLGIALVGYARGNRLSVYSHPERLGRSAWSTVNPAEPGQSLDKPLARIAENDRRTR